MPKAFDKGPRITYPSGCKDLSEDLTKDELIKRLKALARVFQDMSQEGDENLKELSLYLASEFFMDHSNRDVKCLVACCIADIFRIFAPEAPFTDPEHLKEIFLFLSRQLKGLEDPNAPSFKRYFYLLENLAWVKSFNICLELEDNQEIFCELFKLIFSIVNGNHSNKVVNFMLDMLSPLLSEADNVSQDLLDILLANIIEPNKSNNRPAHNLAKELIRRTANQLEPYIQTFFNNLLMLGKTSESELSGRLFDLIYELNAIAPSVLLAVLPQLEFKLKSSDKKERKAVTKLLAKMFSDTDSQLAVQNRQLWTCFLGRFKDIELEVRKICVLSCQDFITNHQELMPDIAEALKERCHDTDESIRMDVIHAIVTAGKRDFTCVTDGLLQCIRDRTLDKKYNIRKEALMGLGAMYKKCTMTEDIDQHHVERISWVKSKVLHGYYQNNVEDRILVERILNMSLVPYSLDSSARMKKLLSLYCTVDEHAVKALNELFKTQMNVKIVLRNLLELQLRPDKEENKDVRQQIITRVVALSKNLPESTKALPHMKDFNEKISKDPRMRTSLIRLLAPDCACKKAGDYVKEILQKCGNCVAANLFYSNVKSLLERVAPVMIDNEALVELLVFLDDAINGLKEINDEIPDVAEKGIKLLFVLSHVYPGAFHSEEVYSKLISFVKHSDDVVVDTTIQVFTNVGRDLEKTFPSVYSSLIPVLQKLVKIGTPKQAKHAIRCIAAIYGKKETIFTQIFEHLKKNMDLDSPNFLTSLVAIGHMAQLCPDEFSAPVTKIVTGFIVKQLLMKDEGRSRSSNEEWYADHLVSDETQAKVQALKMIVRWLLGLRFKEENSGTSTFRLLHTVIVHEGDLMEHGKINKAEMARLRLQAGCSMLKLAQVPFYEPQISLEYFQALAMLINDPCLQVRIRFAQKLHKGLITFRLPLQYMSIFCYAANDPLKERRTQVKNYLLTNVNKRRDYLKTNTTANAKLLSVLPEYVVPYAIHLLAHEPDLKNCDDVETLKIIKDCLWFILEALITKNDNYSFTFYKKLVENIKQTKDAQCPNNKTNNEKMYAVCDLTYTLIMTKSSSFVLKDFPAEPILPAKLFTDPDLSYSNTKIYIPMELRAEQMKQKKFGSYVPGTAVKISGTSSSMVNDAAALLSKAAKSGSGGSNKQRTNSASSPSSNYSSPDRPKTGTSQQAPQKAGRGRKPSNQSGKGDSSQNTTLSSQQNGKLQRQRGRPPKKKVEYRSSSSEDEDMNTFSDNSDSSPNPPAARKLGTSSRKPQQQAPASSTSTTTNYAKTTQGKITDFVTRARKSLSPIKNKENTLSSVNKKAGNSSNTTAAKKTACGASTEKTVSRNTLAKKGAQAAVRETSPPVLKAAAGRRKRAASNSSIEASPAKFQKNSPVKQTRGKKKDADIVPSPSTQSSQETPKKMPPKKAGKAAAEAKSNVRHSKRMLNGRSDGDDSPATTISSPSPGKKRVTALARAMEQKAAANTMTKRARKAKR